MASKYDVTEGRKPSCERPTTDWLAAAMVAIGTRIARTGLISSLGSNVGGTDGLKPHAFPAHSRQTDRRGTSAQCPNHGRLSVVSREALPSTTSAGNCVPLFGRFHGTMASSDFSSACMLGVRHLPSRAGSAQVRARVRSPRFRAKNFSTCTRSPTARGSSHASHLPWDDVAFSSPERDWHLGIRPVSQLKTWPVVSPVNASRLPSRAEPRASLGVGVVG
jgi:hypothetical protein